MAPPLRLLTALVVAAAASVARAAEPCVGLDKSLFLDTVLSAEPATGARTQYRAKVGLTFANTGGDWLALQTLRVPVGFSRRVLTASGAWAVADAKDFIVSCWTLEKVDSAGAITEALPCSSIGGASLTSDNTLELAFTQPVFLCPGCGLRGAGGDAFIVVQHKEYLTLDRDSMVPKPLTCGGKLQSIALGQVEEPDRGPLPPALARMNPTCTPWFAAVDGGNGRPTVAPASALSQLTLTTSVNFVLVQTQLPASSTNAGAWEGKAPTEVLFAPVLRNGGTSAVPLLGVRIPLAFAPRVLVPTSPPRWASAHPDEFILECWGGQTTTASGARPPRDLTVCSYATLQPSADGRGLDLAFNGGSLCAKCTLTGTGPNGVLFALKHLGYIPIDADKSVLTPLSGAVASVPSAPPIFCGVPGAVSTLSTTEVLKPRSACPLKPDFQPSCAVTPYPATPANFDIDAHEDDWFSFNTELRLVPNLVNGGSRPLLLKGVRLEFLFDFRVYAGPTSGWIRRPPSEFGWTCWYGASQGPQSDGVNLCNATVVLPDAPSYAEQTFGMPDDDGAPAKVVITFNAGWLCPGCSLVGGKDGVLGAWHHMYFMPLAPTGFSLSSVSCADGAAKGANKIVYTTSSPPPPPPLPSPPPQQPPVVALPREVQPPVWFGTPTIRSAVELQASTQVPAGTQDAPGGVRGVTALTADPARGTSAAVVTSQPPQMPRVCPWWRPTNC